MSSSASMLGPYSVSSTSADGPGGGGGRITPHGGGGTDEKSDTAETRDAVRDLSSATLPKKNVETAMAPIENAKTNREVFMHISYHVTKNLRRITAGRKRTIRRR